MQDYSNRAKHFRALASMVGTTFGQWAIFMLIEEVITHATEGDGILSKEKIKYKISDYIILIFKNYYSHLKPIGGSFAGAKKPAPAIAAPNAGPASSTRQNTSTTQQDTVVDTTGDSDLQQLIKDIVADNNLDDRDAQTVHSAASYFKLILEKILEDPIYGLRRNANKFHSFHVGNRDAFQILDDVMQELHPLEILIVGPDVTMLQEFSHATTHAASLRIDDIARWRSTLRASFRSSTTTAEMSDSLLMDRQPHLQHLAYLTSLSFEFRLKTRQPSGSTTYHAARGDIQPIINRAILDKTMTGETIAAELRPILKLHPGTNMKTLNWRSSTPRDNHNNTVPHAHSARAGSEQASDGNRQHQAHVSRFSLNDGSDKPTDKRRDPHSHQPPQTRHRPKSHPAQARPRPNKAGTKCHDCGQEGHWAGDTECLNPKTRQPQSRANNNSGNNQPKAQRGGKTLHWSATTSQ